MYSTSSYCLLKSNAKGRRICDAVYSNWSTVLSACILLMFLLSTAKGQDQKNNTEDIFSNTTDDNATENEESEIEAKENFKIRAFYGQHDYIKLNISWTLNTDIADSEYNLHISKLEDNEHCRRSYNNYSIKRGQYNFAILPVEDNKEVFIRGCCYSVEIKAVNSTNQRNIIFFNYTIPDTSPVKNITAMSIYLEEKDSVVLNVSWTNPTDDILPKSYVIQTKPVRDGHCTRARPDETFNIDALDYRRIRDVNPLAIGFAMPDYYRYVGILPQFVIVLLQNQSSAIIPAEHSHVEIVPGCRYKINIIAQPANDLSLNQAQIDFLVEDCVGKKCSCHNTQKPPAPNIRVTQKSNDVISVTWNITENSFWTDGHNLTTIYFSIHASHHSPVLVQKKTITNHEAMATNIEEIVTPDLSPGVLYQLVVWVENEQYCRSNSATSTFPAKFPQENHWTNQVVIPIMFGMIFTLLICITWKRKCACWYRKISNCINHHQPSPPQLRRIYRPGAEGYRATRPYLAVPMEINNLYLDNEVIEEIKCGNVDEYEITYNRLKFGKEIGNGAFGHVFVAKINGIDGIPGYSIVAVKKLKKTTSPEAMDEFLQEIAMLKHIGRHQNIVTFLGCCTLKQPYCIVMEYVMCGDLLHYLRALRTQYEQKEKRFLFTVNTSLEPNFLQDKQRQSDGSYIVPDDIPADRLPSLTETEYTVIGSDVESLDTQSSIFTPSPCASKTPVILECAMDPTEWQSFAIQIARGMEHLEQKQIVHRDLAARNILIDEHKTLKISDFGMSRSGIYVNSKHNKFPLRWVSIEAIRDHLYTSKSDVWSFGIVLWEIGTLGGFPYPTIADHEILPFLLQGKRLEKPENCTPELYQLMQLCWSHCVDSRPSFKELMAYLNSFSNKHRVYIDFSQLNPSYVFPPMEQQTFTQFKIENNITTIEMVLHDT